MRELLRLAQPELGLGQGGLSQMLLSQVAGDDAPPAAIACGYQRDSQRNHRSVSPSPVSFDAVDPLTIQDSCNARLLSRHLSVRDQDRRQLTKRGLGPVAEQ